MIVTTNKRKVSFYCENKGYLCPKEIKDNVLIYERFGSIENTEVNQWITKSKTNKTKIDGDYILYKTNITESVKFEHNVKFTYILKIIYNLTIKHNLSIVMSNIYKNFEDDLVMSFSIKKPNKEEVRKDLEKVKTISSIYDVEDDLHFLIKQEIKKDEPTKKITN